MELTESQVEEVIRENIYHPEFRINVVDLGLIYDIEVSDGKINVVMTTPNPQSPKAGALASEVETLLTQEFENLQVGVSFTWEPEWNPNMMSNEAKAHLGY